jgi:NADH-quinone oxidoreductase subunit L
MTALLWLIPALPLAGFLLLALAGPRLGRRTVAAVGVGSVGASAGLAVALGLRFLADPSAPVVRSAWAWFRASGLAVGIDFRLDALSCVFVLVVTFVGFLIHLYASESMSREGEGYSRFFSYMNLFVGFMLVLVLADNLLLLYLGWEGVGLCSYLLIGFWYKEPANGRAARKAFIVTRVGDTAFAVGLFLLIKNLGTLAIPEVTRRAALDWPSGSGLAVATALLLLGGAVGKSAQLPLQTWLPDAMAGPTPVSALIHAATMVTAGVYLLCRMHVIVELAPVVQLIIGIVGAATLLLSGLSALAQTDIKRVLAYSTISQIGYMFLAMGAGAFAAATFHFMTHAFFKALLFLAAGAVIDALHDEHDIFKMGGLRREMPFVFWTFFAGAASLAALPFMDAGFYSKGLILESDWAAGTAGRWFWAAGAAGAFLTAAYTFRMFFLVFFGEKKRQPDRLPGPRMAIPLGGLAFFSVFAGFINVPRLFGGAPVLVDLLRRIFPRPAEQAVPLGLEAGLEAAVIALVLIGVYLAYAVLFRRPVFWRRLGESRFGAGAAKFLHSGFGFDAAYDLLFVRPFAALARWNKRDVIDLFYTGLGRLALALHRLLSLSQSGALVTYVRAVVAGAIIILALVVLL